MIEGAPVFARPVGGTRLIRQIRRRSPVILWALLALCGVLAGCAAPAGAVADRRGTDGTSLLEPWGDISGGLLTSDFGQTSPRYVTFVRPTSVAARGNFVYVVDTGARRIYRYDRTTRRLTAYTQLAPGADWEIYAAPDMTVYLSEPAARRIAHYDWNGMLINTFSDDANLGRPTAFAVDEATGEVLVADGLYHQVVGFNPLGAAVSVIRPCGEKAVGMDSMTAMALTRDEIYLVDRIAKRVVVQQRRSAACRVLGEDDLTDPGAIAVDRFRRVYVGDNYDDTIKVFSPDGRLLAQYGGSGAGPSHFNHIAGLWIDANVLYVADSLNGRIGMLLITPQPTKGEK